MEGGGGGDIGKVTINFATENGGSCAISGAEWGVRI